MCANTPKTLRRILSSPSPGSQISVVNLDLTITRMAIHHIKHRTTAHNLELELRLNPTAMKRVDARDRDLWQECMRHFDASARQRRCVFSHMCVSQRASVREVGWTISIFAQTRQYMYSICWLTINRRAPSARRLRLGQPTIYLGMSICCVLLVFV